jgi:hypothetical protein
MNQLQNALAELQQKTLRQIQRETAYTWSYRALAAYQLYQRTANAKGKMRWLLDSQEYAHEALEHAALAGMVPEIDTLLGPLKNID